VPLLSQMHLVHTLPHYFPMVLTYSFTPWCRILFEKLIVTQVVKKISCFLMEPEGSLPCSQKPPLDPILSQLNPVRTVDPCLLKVHLNVILPPTSRSSKCFFFRSSNENIVCISHLPISATCPTHLFHYLSTKYCAHFTSLLSVLHAQPISHDLLS
jgi:hypothetical protein